MKLWWALCLIQLAGCSRGSAASRVDALAALFLDIQARYDPAWATSAGYHMYDDRLITRDSTFLAGLKTEARALLAETEAVDTSRLPLSERVDLRLVRMKSQRLLFDLEVLRPWEIDPLVYAWGVLDGLYYLTLHDYWDDTTKARLLAARLAEIPRVVGEAEALLSSPDPVKQMVALEILPPAKRFIEGLTGQLSVLQGEELAQAVAAQGRAAGAVKELETFVRELRPGPAGSFVLGDENYERLLWLEHGLSLTADSLILLGEAWVETLSAKIDSLEGQVPPREPVDPDSVPRGFGKAGLFAYYAKEIERMRVWADEQFCDVPDYVGPLRAVEMPQVLRPIIPGIAMEPPPALDTVSTGTYFTRPVPDTMSGEQRAGYWKTVLYRGFRGGTVHEGFPGHHLQLSLANANPSLARKLWHCSSLIEGWALYCEGAVWRAGLYGKEGDDDWLRAKRAVLGGLRFRAVRVVLDASLQTGRMSFDEAVEYMVEKTGNSYTGSRGEVMRYVTSPTQPMSYLVGMLLISGMEERWEGSDREFRDALLSKGSIPAPFISEELFGKEALQ